MKKVAVVGIVGLPAKYGGFETLVQFITTLKKRKDLKYTVYCSSRGFQKKSNIGDVELIYIPLKANGMQSVFYDIWSILKSLRYETILILGVSGCLILPLVRLLSSAKIIVNIDGIEHKRAKWGKFASFILKQSERFAIKFSHQIIADNKAVASYLQKTYNKESAIIPYGGDQASYHSLTLAIKNKYRLPDKYAFKVCRIEPENNIGILLDAFSKSEHLPLVLVGNWGNSNYGKELKASYEKFSHLYLLDPIYEQDILDQIRSNCFVYVHGHSAGGTNPSLVEAMCLGLPIVAYDISFNRETTKNKALYFSDSSNLASTIESLDIYQLKEIGKSMYQIAMECYRWDSIVEQYEQLY